MIRKRSRRRSMRCLPPIWRLIATICWPAVTNSPGNNRRARLRACTNDCSPSCKRRSGSKMCGIAGIVWTDRLRPAPIAEAAAMAAALHHRGPDDGDVFAEGPIALSHRRLSIIDLSTAGRQPMHSSDGSLVIVYNGEIYNYLELREELRRAGHLFRTDTDTEVILEAYRCWGAECVSRFNGMWAFAIYDRRRREVFLSRDRFGIKPLYYTDDKDRFAFASEIKALLSVFRELRRPNLPIVHYFLPSGALD